MKIIAFDGIHHSCIRRSCVAVLPPAAAGRAVAWAVPDARQSGGEPDGIVQVANLVYAGTKSSRCFSDHFLIKAEKETCDLHQPPLPCREAVERQHLRVSAADHDRRGRLPACPTAERESLRRYVERGGFLLASAGCSSTEWDRAFRREMATIFPNHPLQAIDMSHPMFHTVYDIKELHTTHGGSPRPLVGVSIGGRLGVVYSQDGLNDTPHTTGCCCCGGNELENADRHQREHPGLCADVLGKARIETGFERLRRFTRQPDVSDLRRSMRSMMTISAYESALAMSARACVRRCSADAARAATAGRWSSWPAATRPAGSCPAAARRTSRAACRAAPRTSKGCAREAEVVLVDVGGAAHGTSPYDLRQVRGHPARRGADGRCGAQHRRRGSPLRARRVATTGRRSAACRCSRPMSATAPGQLVAEPVRIVSAARATGGAGRRACPSVMRRRNSRCRRRGRPCSMRCAASPESTTRRSCWPICRRTSCGNWPTPCPRPTSWSAGRPASRSARSRLGPTLLGLGHEQGQVPRPARCAGARIGRSLDGQHRRTWTSSSPTTRSRRPTSKRFRDELGPTAISRPTQTVFRGAAAGRVAEGLRRRRERPPAGNATRRTAASWRKSKHAAAWKSLEAKGAHVDPDCQRCHTTGYGLPGGFASVRRSGGAGRRRLRKLPRPLARPRRRAGGAHAPISPRRRIIAPAATTARTARSSTTTSIGKRFVTEQTAKRREPRPTSHECARHDSCQWTSRCRCLFQPTRSSTLSLACGDDARRTGDRPTISGRRRIEDSPRRPRTMRRRSPGCRA